MDGIGHHNSNGKPNNHHMSSNHPGQQTARSIFVERDYTQGIQVRFLDKFPPELEGKLEPGTFQAIIQRLNEIYEDAETPSCATAWENCIGCCTCYLAFLFMESRYNHYLKKARSYIAEQNRTLSARGVTFVDPYERGMRLIEIRIK
ncbi:golgin subfamily A member 7-like isoform X2 [Paramacrobiotus metropolitanus]|uniref:golgin subfamily A member 7-like isoform X2 n=1 Tax=Paramacrobiotus metropolitanus TaxID=2943436 RepID=UPI002445AE85|nr:golgin subfamily A member 7-like isoform X2 [Paramacrobiotus metropolitanus]